MLSPFARSRELIQRLNTRADARPAGEVLAFTKRLVIANYSTDFSICKGMAARHKNITDGAKGAFNRRLITGENRVIAFWRGAGYYYQ